MNRSVTIPLSEYDTLKKQNDLLIKTIKENSNLIDLSVYMGSNYIERKVYDISKDVFIKKLYDEILDANKEISALKKELSEAKSKLKRKKGLFDKLFKRN
jgi:hypothetical protein